MTPNKQRYDNLQLGYFPAEGRYDIPKLNPEYVSNMPELISFNYAKSTVTNRKTTEED